LAALHAREKLIRILAFTMVLSSMSATMFNLALPRMKEDFGLTLAQVSWVSSIYLLVYAIGSVFYGKLSDRYPLKSLLTFGIGLFAVGSAVGIASPTYGVALLARILQAAGAAVVPAAAMIVPVRFFPPEKRGRALGITATGLALGNAIGPVAAAAVLGLAGWRWLFAVPLLLVFTLPAYRAHLADEPRAPGRIDWLGGGLLAAAVALLLLAVTQGGRELGLGSLVLFGLFLVRIRAAREPFAPPRLFRNGSYSAGLGIAVLVVGIGYSLPFLTPQLLSGVQGLRAEWVGAAMMPAAAASALLGRKAGKLADLRGAPFLFGLASALLTLGFLLLSTFAGAPAAVVALLLMLANVGQTFMQIALTKTISVTLPKEQTGVGMGLLSMLNFLSGAVASGLYGRAVDGGAAASWNPLQTNGNANVFGNVYLLLAAAHALLFLLYRARFGAGSRPDAPQPAAPAAGGQDGRLHAGGAGAASAAALANGFLPPRGGRSPSPPSSNA